MAKMNPKVKELWIAALLSKKYEQAPGQLKTQAGGFCCLGVLCDVFMGQPGAESEWGGVREHSIQGNEGVLPQFVDDWAEMPGEHFDLWHADLGTTINAEEHLASMNDDQGKTFKDIAKWIQENL